MTALPATTTSERIPPLENGDCLSRDEFERRYHAMPNVKKAELIEGVVHMPSPERWKRHSRPQVRLLSWLNTYEVSTLGVEVGGNATVRLDLENEPQPDAILLIDPAYGGRARFSEDDYVEEGPELVAEVAASTASIALNAKFRAYCRNGVREYIVWRVLDKAIDWFVLRRGQYRHLSLGRSGIYQSKVFPGLWLDPTAMIAFDWSKVLEVLQQGLATPEHAAFVARLERARRARS